MVLWWDALMPFSLKKTIAMGGDNQTHSWTLRILDWVGLGADSVKTAFQIWVNSSEKQINISEKQILIPFKATN